MRRRLGDGWGEEVGRAVPGPELASDEVVARAAALLRAAGDPARLRLLERLLRRGERCVSELASECGDGLSTVSQRLKTLRLEQLVTRRREGKHIYYALADAHIGELVSMALAHAGEAPPEVD